MNSRQPTPDGEALIAGYLSSYPAELGAFVGELRCHLREEARPAFELAAPSTQSFNIGYGFTTKAWDCFVAIIVYRKHLNLSFPSGASLEDPEGILHGTGSRIRHLKLSSLADLEAAPAGELLAAARRHSLYLLRDESIDSDPKEVITRVRPPQK